MMTYKGYIAHIEYDDDAENFHGEVVNIRDVITFQGSAVKELKKAFIDSVEDYLAYCAERGKQPDGHFPENLICAWILSTSRVIFNYCRKKKR